MTSTNAFLRITLRSLASKLIGNTTGKHITTLKHFGICKLSVYKKLLYLKIGLTFEEEGWGAYL